MIFKSLDAVYVAILIAYYLPNHEGSLLMWNAVSEIKRPKMVKGQSIYIQILFIAVLIWDVIMLHARESSRSNIIPPFNAEIS